MAMSIKPTEAGGRVIQADTPWGRFHAEWDAAGRLVYEECEIRTPAGHQPQQTSAGCNACEQGRRSKGR